MSTKKKDPNFTPPKPPSRMEYIAAMLLEASERRKDAKNAGTDHLRKWYLSRAAFFEECAQEAQLKVDRDHVHQQTEVD